MNVIQDFLLIENHQIFKLYQEFLKISLMLVGPCFLVAICIEFLGGNQFTEVLKKLVIIILFMNFFYSFHKEVTYTGLKLASTTIKKISPNNFFLKGAWSKKVETKYNFKSLLNGSIFYANIVNDIVTEVLYVLCHIFLWLLKLIFSTVYHFTYLFSAVSALLYFFNWTSKSLVGTFQSSLWCTLMPFFVISIFILVSETITFNSLKGETISFKELIWLFGVCLLLFMSPLIVFAFVKGEGIASFGAKMGQSIVSAGMTAMTMMPLYYRRMQFGHKMASQFGNAFKKGFGEKYGNPFSSFFGGNQGKSGNNNFRNRNSGFSYHYPNNELSSGKGIDFKGNSKINNSKNNLLGSPQQDGSQSTSQTDSYKKNSSVAKIPYDLNKSHKSSPENNNENFKTTKRSNLRQDRRLQNVQQEKNNGNKFVNRRKQPDSRRTRQATQRIQTESRKRFKEI